MKPKLHDWQRGLPEELAFADDTDFEIMQEAQVRKGLRKLSSRDWQDIRGMPMSKSARPAAKSRQKIAVVRLVEVPSDNGSGDV